MSPLAVGRSFGGLSAPPVTCPYRAEQATGLAGGYDYEKALMEAEIVYGKTEIFCVKRFG